MWKVLCRYDVPLLLGIWVRWCCELRSEVSEAFLTKNQESFSHILIPFCFIWPHRIFSISYVQERVIIHRLIGQIYIKGLAPDFDTPGIRRKYIPQERGTLVLYYSVRNGSWFFPSSATAYIPIFSWTFYCTKVQYLLFLQPFYYSVLWNLVYKPLETSCFDNIVAHNSIRN